ncbi:undecaprenyldiphospho-muramoylpentapeptide beta-N-acetylglucosaminyltransferase [Gammaproteobacteria bacterium AB-CW1]|uniref:UDP-N-acetylglucosamine--N-acetylmuramyl-(pentapeptide) pyrophosphoryl-undecaprenol N-acetylglucosamine transferase n=1 Tax=Natronospira elongata TaxID=3110268 RepID=A0AAP6MJI3_9GAMM|nr:undecaprenyldiphospho-muramoylpentapeptide beta-N-acetylglucosaminyltransferase [Gammaproteobacteria bacterium AB-CW1]
MSRGHIVIMAGGTGGHVFPGLAVADCLRERGWEVSWLGTRAGLEASVVPDREIELDCIQVSGIRGRGLLGWLLLPLRLSRAVWQALRVLRRRRPDMVLGMGGFASGPGGLAARLLRVPLVIHEQNAIAGLTNRVLAHFAQRVLCGFPGSFPDKVGAETVGNPVRRAVTQTTPPERRLPGRSGPIRVLIVGGSRGARALNQHVPAALAAHGGDVALAVRHQCGRGWEGETREHWQALGGEAEVLPFIDDMAEAWAWADLAICRSGALTVSELAAAGVASILIPFPAAVDDHQTANAEFLEASRAARLLPQDRLEAGELKELLEPLLGNRSQLLEMAKRARLMARPDADQVVADACEAVAAERRGGGA